MSEARFTALTGGGERAAFPFRTFLPDGVMVAQATLTRLVMVRIHVGQPVSWLKPKGSSRATGGIFVSSGFVGGEPLPATGWKCPASQGNISHLLREFVPYRSGGGEVCWGVMNLIPRRVHGVLDYVVGALLLLGPGLLGFEGAARAVPMVLGLAALLYSLCTDYELGLFKLLVFRAHLALDLLNGSILALSPWLFGFAESVWLPHVVLGVVEIGVVVMTRTAASEAPTSPVA